MSPSGLRKFKRPASLGGAGLLPFLFLGVVAWGCEPPDGGATERAQEEARALGLPSGALLHRVTLGGKGSQEHAVPTRILASPGDGVEFRTVDHRVHTVEFLSDSLTVEVRGFLESSGQMASPPLVARGARFVLRLQNAPRGLYFFKSEGHGGTALGVVEVGIPADADSSQVHPS